MKKTLKQMFGELLDPIKNFHRMRTVSAQIIIIAIPIICGGLCYLIGSNLDNYNNLNIYEFLNDILGQFLTILALFISFTMGYLSIIITSGSKNVDDLKGTFSVDFVDKSNINYSLYQILTTEITYTVIVEIIVLILCIIQKFILYFCSNLTVRILCSADVMFFVYVLLLVVINVKNMYFSFWKSK